MLQGIPVKSRPARHVESTGTGARGPALPVGMPPSKNLHVSRHRDALQTLSLGVFIESSSLRHDELNYWPLVINLTFSPSGSLEIRLWGSKFQASNPAWVFLMSGPHPTGAARHQPAHSYAPLTGSQDFKSCVPGYKREGSIPQCHSFPIFQVSMVSVSFLDGFHGMQSRRRELVESQQNYWGVCRNCKLAGLQRGDQRSHLTTDTAGFLHLCMQKSQWGTHVPSTDWPVTPFRWH